MKLGELTKVWECNEQDPPDADTTIISRIGSRDNVGKVMESGGMANIVGLNKFICIKPLDNEKLLPKYLYYVMMHTHSQGYWKRVSTPYAQNSYKIRVKDVKEIPVQTNE